MPQRFVFKLKTYGVDGDLLNLLENALTCRQQRVILNGQTCSWQNNLGSLLFQIYINDQPDTIASICEIFADDTSLFLKVNDKNNCNTQLNSDLEAINKWVFQWQILFNPDTNKYSIEVCFFYSR